jgi:hypothetical protein
MENKIDEYKEGFRNYADHTPAGAKMVFNMLCKEYEKEIERLKRELDGTHTNIRFIVEDEGGYKYGSFSKIEDAEEQAQEEADERRADLFVKKETTEIVRCVIPD